jgi:hypothetical protein
MIFGLGAYFVGMFQGQLFTAITATGQEGTSPFMQNLQLVVSLLLPDFSLFTVADTAAAGTPLGWAMVGSLALIAAAYMLIHLLIAAWIFAHKEF